jgi:hypothetical protein
MSPGTGLFVPMRVYGKRRANGGGLGNRSSEDLMVWENPGQQMHVHGIIGEAAVNKYRFTPADVSTREVALYCCWMIDCISAW